MQSVLAISRGQTPWGKGRGVNLQPMEDGARHRILQEEQIQVVMQPEAETLSKGQTTTQWIRTSCGKA